tara:strand:- start:1048 stop:1818 length:771 start_codon:yes stop_codon:yes gene_type:complete
MKTITITVHNRPQYLEKLLEGLAKNNLDGWDIVVGLEPAPRKSEQLELIERYIPQANVIHNERQLGTEDNPYNLLSYVFEKLNSKINIYLEEDMIISPDVCELADWYYNLGDDSMCFCLCNIGKIEIDEVNKNGSHSCMFYGNPKMTVSGGGTGWSPIGVLMKKEQWETRFKPNWYGRSTAWDLSVYTDSEKRRDVQLDRPENRILMPYKTRSDHMGEHGGTHVKPGKNWLYGRLAVSYELVRPESYWIYDHAHLS